MLGSVTVWKAKTAASAQKKNEDGAVLEVLGWTMLFMAGIGCVWIWVGWRAGTWFWFWFAAVLGIVGITLAAAGRWKRWRAAKTLAAENEAGTADATLGAPRETLMPDEQKSA